MAKIGCECVVCELMTAIVLAKPIYIALGANLGDPIASFKSAIAQLEEFGVSIKVVSGLWQSPSWPVGQGHPDYINACAQVEYDGSAREFLSVLHAVEAAHGRERSALNAPRQLDLDLIDFRGQLITAKDIKIPHPRMTVRGFVLFPLSQIAPDWSHPLKNEGIQSTISKLPLADIESMKYLGRQNFLRSK